MTAAILLTSASILMPALSAQADGTLLLSPDGVHYSQTYTGELFHDLGRMVPGDAQEGRFWVRNASSGTAYLRVGISSVDASNTQILSSLTMQTTLGDVASEPIPMSAARVCRSLQAPIALAAGASTAVVVRIALASTAGEGTQDTTTDVSMVASLTDATAGEFGDDVCRGDFGTVPNASTTAPPPSPTGAPSSTPAPSPAPTSSATAAPSIGSAPEAPVPTIGNTVRRYQEWAIIVPLLAFLGGMAARRLVARRTPRVVHRERVAVHE